MIASLRTVSRSVFLLLLLVTTIGTGTAVADSSQADARLQVLVERSPVSGAILGTAAAGRTRWSR